MHAPRNGPKKPTRPNRRGLFPFGAEDVWIELGPRQKSQYDGAGARQKHDPRGFGAERFAAGERADRQLRHGPNHDFGKRRGDLQPVRDENRDQRQQKPKCRDEPHLIHPGISFSTCLVVLLRGREPTLPQRDPLLGVIGRSERR